MPSHHKNSYIASVGARPGRAALRLVAVPAAILGLSWLLGSPGYALDKPAETFVSGAKFETYQPANFERSTTIDNKWLPMKPGTRWVYEGTTVEDDGKKVPHRIEIAVTDLVKVINGVRTVVSYDLDYTDGELVEAELAFYAQDNDGNVWRFGEYPEEYEDGKITATPAWIDGLEGARAGVMMQAHPRIGTPSYAQGWGPAVGWTDRGQVHKVGSQTTVATGDYADVLIIAETSQSEKDAQQLKYYAPYVGNVRVGWTGTGEKSQETLELVRIDYLTAGQMDEIRAKAHKLEQSAYKISKNVYARTLPLYRRDIEPK